MNDPYLPDDETDPNHDWAFDRLRKKAEADSVGNLQIVEEICGTAIIIMLIICAAALAFHWT